MFMILGIALCNMTAEGIKGTDQEGVAQSSLKSITTLEKLDHFLPKNWRDFLGVP